MSDLVWWPEHKIAEFVVDVETLGRPKISLADFAVNTLANPMPAEVKAYYNRERHATYHRVRRTPCVLRCPRCQSLIEAEWPSLTAVKEKRLVLGKSTPQESCKVCKEKSEQEIILAVSKKWEDYLEKYRTFCEAQAPQKLSFFKHLKLATEVFKNNRNFQDNTWHVRGGFPPQFHLLLKENLITLRFADDGLDLNFVKFTVDRLTYQEHGELFLRWALQHVEAEGERVCYGPLEMSEKYREDLQEMLAKSSYYQLSYALYRAERDAIATAAMKKISRSITFKSVLLYSLQKLTNDEWSVSEGAKASAERTVHDSFWRLVRLKEHSVPQEILLSSPLHLLSRLIELHALPEDDREAFLNDIIVPYISRFGATDCSLN